MPIAVSASFKKRKIEISPEELIPVDSPMPMSAIAARKAAAAALLASQAEVSPSSATAPVPAVASTSAKASASKSESTPKSTKRSKSKLNSAPASSKKSKTKATPASKPVVEEDPSYLDSSDNEDITFHMNGEAVNLGNPSTSFKNGEPSRYWDSGDLPPLETTGKSISAQIDLGVQRAWSPSGPDSRNETVDNSDSDIELETTLVDRRIQFFNDTTVVEESVSVMNSKKKRKEKFNSGPVTISNFLPSFGFNLVRISNEELRKVFRGVVHDSECAVVVGLKAEETLVFSGICSLTPLHGCTSIFASTLLPSSRSYPIYAPTSHPLPVLRPSSKSPSHSSSPLLSYVSLPPHWERNFECSFILRSHHSSGLESIGSVIPEFSGVWRGPSSGWGVKGLYPILSQESNLVAHEIPESWEDAFSSSVPSLKLHGARDDDEDVMNEEDEMELYAPWIGLVKGPKRSGKSGFGRCLVNRLLERYEKVAWLECDVGQSEFMPEGFVSLCVVDQPLLGPSFTHSAVPFRSHYIGSPSPKHNPSQYLACIADLLESFRLSIQYPPTSPSSADPSSKISTVVPVVINTQGWVKGLGMDLLLRIESLSKPTHSFEFEVRQNNVDQGWDAQIPSEGGWGKYSRREAGEEDFYGQPRSFQHEYQLQPIPESTLHDRWNATDLRTLSMMSYFHAHFSPASPPSPSEGVSQLATSWDFSLPLVAHLPWEVSWKETLDAVYLIGPGSSEVIPEEILLALSGSIVALVVPDGYLNNELAPPSLNSSLPPYHPSYTVPPPSDCSSVGLAIIRTIDTKNLTFEILTPLPTRLLQNVKIIVRGGGELPVMGMVDWRDADQAKGICGVELENVPFLEEANSGADSVVGGGKRRVRRNVMRRGQN